MVEENWGPQVEPVDWADREREPFTRSFLDPLQEEPEDAASLREALDINVEDTAGEPMPRPVERFEQLSVLPEYALQSLRESGIVAPLPIQAQALPLVLSGHDVIGLAQTGSGKTLAFLLPAIVHMEAQRPLEWGAATPITLVLAPTRELAVQIAEEGSKVLRHSKAGNHRWGCKAVCLYGGGNKREQAKALSGAQVVVATPGRLIDFVASQTVSLERVTYFVLDEADRMLDMGFQSDVAVISGQVRPERQVLFFSATWSRSVQELARGLCREGSRPVRISVKQPSSGVMDEDVASRQAREGIVQEVIVVDFPQDYERQEAEKQRLLEEYLTVVLSASSRNKVLVFVSQKNLADDLCTKLWEAGFSTGAMHGGKAQESRLWTLDCFRKGKLQLLVATDVVGRGIDIPSVTHVVVFDMGGCEDYVHRIGRTARGKDAKGCALVFFEYYYKEPGLAARLMSVLEASKQPVPAGLRAIAEQVARGERDMWDPTANWGRGAVVPAQGASAAAREGLGVQGSWDRHLALLLDAPPEEAPSSHSNPSSYSGSWWENRDYSGRRNDSYHDSAFRSDDVTNAEDQKWRGSSTAASGSASGSYRASQNRSKDDTGEGYPRQRGNNSAHSNKANGSFHDSARSRRTDDADDVGARRRGNDGATQRANDGRASAYQSSSYGRGGNEDANRGNENRRGARGATNGKANNYHDSSSHDRSKDAVDKFDRDDKDDKDDDETRRRGRNSVAVDRRAGGNGRSDGATYGGSQNRGGNDDDDDRRRRGKVSTSDTTSRASNGNANDSYHDSHHRGSDNTSNDSDQRWKGQNGAGNNRASRSSAKAQRWADSSSTNDNDDNDNHDNHDNHDDHDNQDNQDNHENGRWRGSSSATNLRSNHSHQDSHSDRVGNDDTSNRGLKNGEGDSNRSHDWSRRSADSSDCNGGRWRTPATESTGDGWQSGVPVKEWLALVDPTGGMQDFLPTLHKRELETDEQVLAKYTARGEFLAERFFRDVGITKYVHKQLVRRWLRQRNGA